MNRNKLGIKTVKKNLYFKFIKAAASKAAEIQVLLLNLFIFAILYKINDR